MMGIIVKDAYAAGATLTGVLAVRLLVAAGIWVALLAPRLDRIPWRSREFRGLAVAGGIGVGMASLAEYAAYKTLAVALVIVVLFMAPAWIALFQWLFLKRSIGLGGTAGLVAVLSGLFLLTEPGAAGFSLSGVGFATLGSIGIALLFLLVERGISRLGAVVSAALVAWGAAPVALVAAVFDGTLTSSFTTSAVVWRGALLGVLATVISFVLLFSAVVRLGAYPAAVVSTTEPVFAALLAWTLLGESLGAAQIVGAAFVVAGTLIVEHWRARAEPAARAVVS